MHRLKSVGFNEENFSRLSKSDEGISKMNEEEEKGDFNVNVEHSSKRIREESGSSVGSSIKHSLFIPSTDQTKLTRRIIQSIVLNVRRRKSRREKFSQFFRQRSSLTSLHQLGFQFLRLYDGKFNYQLGHTFILSFEKKFWLLTIENVQYVECQLGEPEPKSQLILHYKNHLIPVQI